MSKRTRLALGVALALAAPAMAQPMPPPPPGPPPNPLVIHRLNQGMLADLSPAGRRIMQDAMRKDEPDPDRAALTAARLRVLNLLEADRFDMAALRRAMAEERQLAGKRQQRHQEEMLDILRRLSTEDRKVFAKGMREQHERVERARRNIQKRASSRGN